jgi:hypothetical protein
MGAVRGEYLHFRCGKHEIEGHTKAGAVPTYRCGVRGCDLPAKAYWYRGEQYQTLPISSGMIAYG